MLTNKRFRWASTRPERHFRRLFLIGVLYHFFTSINRIVFFFIVQRSLKEKKKKERKEIEKRECELIHIYWKALSNSHKSLAEFLKKLKIGLKFNFYTDNNQFISRIDLF